MRNSKVIKTLKLLSPEEFKNFKHFVNSPFFNRNKKCIKLYELLLGHAPEFDSDKINDADFTKSIYTNKGSLSILFNDFVKLLEEYMAQIRLSENEIYRKYFLLEELRKRGARKHFNLIYSRSVKKNRVKKKNVENYYIEYLLEFSNLNMLYDHVTDKGVLLEHLLATIRAFDKYLIINHLLLDNTVLNEQSIVVSGKTANLIRGTVSNIDKFIEMGNQGAYKNEILIKLHLLLSQLYRNEKEEDFLRLFNALKLNYHLIEKNDYALFFRGMANFPAKKINDGDSHYYDALLKVYSFALDTGIFLDGKYLNTNRMKNIIRVASNFGKISWAKEILNNYIGLIEPDYRDAVRNYCRGYLHFKEKEYDSAERSFYACYNCKSIFELDAAVHLYQIYYITKQSRVFDGSIQAFIARLSRDKEKYYKKNRIGCRNFLRILKRINKLRNEKIIYKKKADPGYRKAIKKNRDELYSMKYIIGKDWLLEQIDDLEK